MLNRQFQWMFLENDLKKLWLLKVRLLTSCIGNPNVNISTDKHKLTGKIFSNAGQSRISLHVRAYTAYGLYTTLQKYAQTRFNRIQVMGKNSIFDLLSIIRILQ